jgi:hypothetical protein
MSMIFQLFRLVPALALALVVGAHPALAAEGPSGTVEMKYQGLTLMAIGAKPDAKSDLAPIEPQAALANLKAAVDLVLQKSAFSVAALKTLEANGNVVIAYNPEFKAARNGLFALAAFLPDFYKRDDPAHHDFLVSVGPHAIRWPTQELAMIVVHELVGHGIQHLNGWLDYVREIDLECNANLYGERFYQDIGIDKLNREVVEFRKALEGHWCADFKDYLKQRDPALMKMWDVRDPDVPKLLALFNDYTAEMRRNGTAGKAIQAAKEMREKEIDDVRRQAAAGDRDAQWQLGNMLRKGVAMKADPAQAAQWLLKAANQGHVQAETDVGVMYANAEGLPRDFSAALAWLEKAVAQGDANAKRLADQLRGIMAKGTAPTR